MIAYIAPVSLIVLSIYCLVRFLRERKADDAPPGSAYRRMILREQRRAAHAPQRDWRADGFK